MTAYWRDGEKVFSPGAKTRLADELIDLVVERLHA
jgi:phosphopantothenoylcysteine decarboxylase/phosphopantothenate--cysteine ligase